MLDYIKEAFGQVSRLKRAGDMTNAEMLYKEACWHCSWSGGAPPLYDNL